MPTSLDAIHKHRTPRVFSAVHLLDQRVSNPCTRTTSLTGMLSSLSHIPISDMYVRTGTSCLPRQICSRSLSTPLWLIGAGTSAERPNVICEHDFHALVSTVIQTAGVTETTFRPSLPHTTCSPRRDHRGWRLARQRATQRCFAHRIRLQVGAESESRAHFIKEIAPSVAVGKIWKGLDNSDIRKYSSGTARRLPFAFCQLPHHRFLVSIVKLRNSSPAAHMRISSLDRVVRARLLTFRSLGRISSLPVCR